jgi:hypothetical protein
MRRNGIRIAAKDQQRNRLSPMVTFQSHHAASNALGMSDGATAECRRQRCGKNKLHAMTETQETKIAATSALPRLICGI